MIAGKIELQDAEMRRALERLYLAMRGQLGVPMRQIGRALKTSTQLRFSEQRAPDGTSWVQSKAATDRHGQTLRKTGRLRNSITYVSDETSVEVGTNVVYASPFQFGFKGLVQVKAHTRKVTMAWGRPLATPVTATVRAHAMRMNIIKREFLGASATDKTAMLDILGRHLLEAAGVGAGE